MGFLPKQSVEIVRIAAGGEPIWIKLQGTQMALRKREAAAILIES